MRTAVRRTVATVSALGLVAVAGMLVAQTQFASAGNINPMSQRYNAKTYGNRATLRQEQKKPPPQRPQRQERQGGGSQY